MSKLKILSCAAVSLLIVGCSAERSEEPYDLGGDATRDLFSEADRRFILAENPKMVVGRDESLPLHNVGQARWLGDRLAITNWHEILFAGPDGRLQGRAGGEGSGPGEFKNLKNLERYGDGFLAWDANLLRLSVLDAMGQFVRSIRVVPERGQTRTRLVGVVGGSALMHTAPFTSYGKEPAAPREIRQEEDYYLVDIDSGEEVAKVTLPGTEELVQRVQDGASFMTGGLSVFFGRTAVAAATGTAAYLGTTDSLSFRILTEDGETRRMTLPHVPRRVDPDWVKFFRDSLRDHTESLGPGGPVLSDGSTFRDRLKRFRLSLLEDLPARATLPAYSDILGDADGRLWIREYPVPGETSVTWTTLSPDGSPTAQLETPLNLNILDIAHGSVVVLSEGDLGEDVVEVYPMEPIS